MGIFLAIIITAIVVSLLWLFAANLATGEKKIDQAFHPDFSMGDEAFKRVISSLLGPTLKDGNRVQALQNGDEIFPAMLEAIRGAKESITFETYIYWSGEIGKQFAEALNDRARAGVKVHVLLDWAGAHKIDAKYVEEMERAGVEVEKFHPIRWYTLSKINNRTHRKLLVVDGRVGFTGGVGIADKWTGHSQDKDHWRDMHYRIEGPAVAQMQSAFIDNWVKVRGCVLCNSVYFPPLERRGDSLAQVFRSSQDEGSESVRLMYLLTIAAARKSVHLSASYFVPDDLSVKTLVAALKRGVTVQIIIPGEYIDSSLVEKASPARWGPLLEAGAELYKFQPTMYHCKVLIVDGIWTSVGSTNFDTRSFRLNAEANLNVLDREFAEAQLQIFEDDKKRARRVTLEEHRNRPLKDKIVERMAELLRSQL